MKKIIQDKIEEIRETQDNGGNIELMVDLLESEHWVLYSPFSKTVKYKFEVNEKIIFFDILNYLFSPHHSLSQCYYWIVKSIKEWIATISRKDSTDFEINTETNLSNNNFITTDARNLTYNRKNIVAKIEELYEDEISLIEENKNEEIERLNKLIENEIRLSNQKKEWVKERKEDFYRNVLN